MTNLIAKFLSIGFILLNINWCGEKEGDWYNHNCDISNQSNDTIMVDFLYVYVSSLTYDYAYAKLCTTEVPPNAVAECRSYKDRKRLIEECDSFRFVFYKNGGNSSVKEDILAIKYATVDSLEKWGWVVTYP
ncbi:MAG: hypothetical protein NC248_01260 [Bacteroides sp.]|nr:hypothetical protein [Lachnospiraceae bacterium]MCM1331219.1 hypothetical protein [Bacteroides sp.]MCM1390336.1 hypothetical protein [Bacteroides sp.]MCM1390883.1 hypothetical protein [Bacteroides sp.]